MMKILFLSHNILLILTPLTFWSQISQSHKDMTILVIQTPNPCWFKKSKIWVLIGWTRKDKYLQVVKVFFNFFSCIQEKSNDSQTISHRRRILIRRVGSVPVNPMHFQWSSEKYKKGCRCKNGNMTVTAYGFFSKIIGATGKPNINLNAL
jgi:hypothetical protein